MNDFEIIIQIQVTNFKIDGSKVKSVIDMTKLVFLMQSKFWNRHISER